jgi:hypothetical protein
MNRRLSAISITLLAFLLGACTANPVAVQTAAAATLAVETPLPSATFAPTYTALPTYTPRPTLTPLIEYVTPTHTAVPQGTPAKSSVGVDFPCADSLTIKVLEKPYFQAEMFNAKPEGKFLVVLMQVTNHADAPIQNMEMASFTLSASLNGKELTIEPHKVSTERLTFNTFGDYRNPAESTFLPEWPVKILVVFDVDPQAADWSLTFAPQASGLQSSCSVEIPLAVR